MIPAICFAIYKTCCWSYPPKLSDPQFPHLQKIEFNDTAKFVLLLFFFFFLTFSKSEMSSYIVPIQVQKRLRILTKTTGITTSEHVASLHHSY